MPKVIFKDTNNVIIKTVNAKIGWSLMETALENQIPGIHGECGGGCSCATCHVYIEPDCTDKISVISEIEEETLEFVDNKVDGLSRLSCQIEITEALDGMSFQVPTD
ncbi:MAG: hypothetical protein CBC29_01085 [Methylococcaceae bacterium TMED69]|nr:MAG: hypothetical protein CBC29_01085 [Methylococcaceae bacterium TMED69]|tara:strand:- start:1614 stop:1934 length:321 start_codon:yes stop_codon:yes gene_type:complete